MAASPGCNRSRRSDVGWSREGYMPTSSDETIVVVGAGLAGLATAAFLARAGAPVTLLERTAEPGGRAQTTSAGPYRMNLGPHALYRGSAGARVLADLGVAYRGGTRSAATRSTAARCTFFRADSSRC